MTSVNDVWHMTYMTVMTIMTDMTIMLHMTYIKIMHRYGTCGDNLECRHFPETGESTCVCREDKEVILLHKDKEKYKDKDKCRL